VLPAIREDLPHKVIVLKEHDHSTRDRHNLERLSNPHKIEAWHTGWKTLGNRII
jgi:hypothetical protein